jgi:hypothetical protein
MTVASVRFSKLLQFGALAAVLVASISWFPQGGSFAGETQGWTVTEIRGDAKMRVGEGPWRDLARGHVLVPRSELETAKNGRIVLAKGGDMITVSPNSRMVIPAHRDGGIVANIFQSLGTLLFKMEPRPEREFRVQTPFLAAAIKGTTFTTTVDGEGASVHVVEGSVEVTAIDTGQAALVFPGQTATVAAMPGANLSIIQGQESGIRKQHQGHNPTRAKGNEDQADPAPAQSHGHMGKKSAQTHDSAVIKKTLGKSNRDISALTDGLITDADQPQTQPNIDGGSLASVSAGLGRASRRTSRGPAAGA